MTIKELLKQAVVRLNQQAMHDSAQLDAELLLAHVLDCQPSFLMAWPDKQLSSDTVDQFDRLLLQRCEGKPVALILGVQEFWSLPLVVNAHTLIPRPDTECLVEYVFNHLGKEKNILLLDAGTGSGAIGLALAKEKPNWFIIASDLSEQALSVAKQNQIALKLGVSFVQGSWLSFVAENSLDVLISNPPYIRSDDPHLQQLTFEPLSALVAEEEGLACIRTLADQGCATLKQSGLLMVEHGYDQRSQVQNIFRKCRYQNISTYKDYGGNDRFTVGTRA